MAGKKQVDNRKSYAQWLITNCSCFKGKGKAALNHMDEEELKNLKANMERAAKYILALNKAKKVIAGNADNADGEEEVVEDVDIAGLADFLGVTEDPKSDPIGFTEALRAKVSKILDRLGGAPSVETPTPEVMTEEINEETPETNMTDEEEEEMMKEESGSVGGKHFVARNDNVNNRLTKEELEDIQFAREIKVKQKAQIANRLVSHLTGNKKKDKFKSLMTKTYKELKELAELIPTSNRGMVAPGNSGFEGEQYFDNGNGGNGNVFFPRGGSFEGAAGGPVGNVNNSNNSDEDEVLPLPTIDWSDKQAR